MIDRSPSPEYRAFSDRIAEHVATIHTASRELLASRQAANDPGPDTMRVVLETAVKQPAADPGDPDMDGQPEVENYCPDGTVPIFVTYECGSPDPFACHDVYCM